MHIDLAHICTLDDTTERSIKYPIAPVASTSRGYMGGKRSFVLLSPPDTDTGANKYDNNRDEMIYMESCPSSSLGLRIRRQSASIEGPGDVQSFTLCENCHA